MCAGDTFSIFQKDTLIRHLQEKVDLFHEHLHEFGQIFNASREPEQDQELLNHKDCIAVSGKVLSNFLKIIIIF